MSDYTVNFSILDESTREIEGVATAPVIDAEKEIILRKAVEDALPNYLKLPVLSYMHSERPVGMVKEARFLDDNSLYIKGWIKDSPDADDVWSKILKGEINAFSIYGRRIEGSSECKLHPNRRTSPCITKAIHMDAITLCGDNKINPSAGFNVVKSLFEDILNNGNTENNVLSKDMETNEIPKGGQEIEKSEVSVEDRLTQIEKTMSEIIETLPVNKGNEMESNTELVEENIEAKVAEEVIPVTKADVVEVTKEETISKAEIVDEITKATEEFRKSVDEIKKSFDTELATLREELESVKNETIQKGGTVVMIEEGKDPQLASGNASALNAFMNRE